jgi:hypothetical protein
MVPIRKDLDEEVRVLILNENDDKSETLFRLKKGFGIN